MGGGTVEGSRFEPPLPLPLRTFGPKVIFLKALDVELGPWLVWDWLG